jgi:hypothetical protein
MPETRDLWLVANRRDGRRPSADGVYIGSGMNCLRHELHGVHELCFAHEMHPKAFPLRGRCHDEGVTDEVDTQKSSMLFADE